MTRIYFGIFNIRKFRSVTRKETKRKGDEAAK